MQLCSARRLGKHIGDPAGIGVSRHHYLDAAEVGKTGRDSESAVLAACVIKACGGVLLSCVSARASHLTSDRLETLTRLYAIGRAALRDES